MFFYYGFVKKKTNPPFFAYIYDERSFDAISDGFLI